MYTEKEEQILIDDYTNNPCLETVDKLSVKLNKPRKSIISKLVKLGVYVSRGYVTKRGEIPITKLELVRNIEDALDVKLPDLHKAPKDTLKLLADTIVDMSITLEETLGELTKIMENEKIRKEMQSVKDKSPFSSLLK